MDSTSETYIEIVHMMTELLWSHVEKELRLQLSDSITQYLNDQLLVLAHSLSFLSCKISNFIKSK